MIFLNLGVRIAAAIFSVPPESISVCLPMMAPLVTSQAEFVKRQEVDAVLETVWQDSDGFDKQADQDDRAFTYGEITSLGARQLFDFMGMQKAGKTDVVFLDLGSGVGKLVVQAYFEVKRLNCAIGIELAQSRHDAAVRAWNRIQKEPLIGANDTDSRMLELRQGDLFQTNISDATHIYVSSLCFSDEMVSRVAEKLLEAPKLQVVATLKEFPLFGKPSFTEFVEMSWTKPLGHGSEVFFYNRQPPL